MRTCTHPGCDKPTRGYSRYCHLHAARQRRFGDANVTTGLRKPLLVTTRKALGRWMQQRSNRAQIEATLMKRVSAMVETARIKLQQEIITKVEHSVAQDVVRVASEVDLRTAALHVAAVSYLWTENPHMWPSERALLFAYARAWRSLTKQSVRTSVNATTGKATQSTTEPPPRHMQALGRYLANNLAAIGGMIHIKQKQDAKEAEEARIGVLTAIDESKPAHAA